MENATIMDLLAEAKDMQDYLQFQIDSTNINALENRGNELCVYMARSGKMLADAKLLLNDKRERQLWQLLREFSDSNVSKTGMNELVKSICKHEQFTVDWIERINRSCTHQFEWCRSLISKAKAEMAMNTFGGGGVT